MKRYLVTDDAITFMVGDKSVTLPKTHEKAAEILAMFQGPASEAQIMAALETAVRKAVKFLGGKLEFREEDGVEVAYYKGLNVGPAVVRRIVEFQRAKLPAGPLVKFLDRLVLNPSRNSVQQLYGFLEHKGFAITPNGTFLGYKGIRKDGYSVSAGDKTQVTKGVVDAEGHIRNWIGDEIEMHRAAVQDDPNVACHTGLHVGTHEYASGFGSQVVMVEVDPADVVSVPHDCSNQKLRCCHYRVVAGYDGRVEAPLAEVRNQKIVQNAGTPPAPKVWAKTAVEVPNRTLKRHGRVYRVIAEDARQIVLQTQSGKIRVERK